MEVEYICTVKSPVGLLTVSSDGRNVSGLWLEGQKYFARTLGENVPGQDLPVFEKVRQWLDTYFSGREPDFMPPLMPRGSPFQTSVWDALRKIPYGQTTSYGELALRLPVPCASARAVGGAVGRNPVSILIPCHRVIGKNGSLTGYAGGIAAKTKLLQLEGCSLAARCFFC